MIRIFIITMDDPLYTIPFFKTIISKKHKQIIGIAASKGDRMKLGKNKSKIVYLFSLLLIMGPFHFIRNSIITLDFKIRKKLSSVFTFIKSPSILTYAERHEIPVFKTGNPNSPEFLEIINRLKPDLIINQSQSIIRKELLALPGLGVINRHNALLPKNRGRLTPFWVLFRKEKETGVSIHFVNEGLDAGPIIVQEKFPVSENESFNSLVKKNYEVAPAAMIKAIELLESGNYELIPNPESEATYNSTPTFREAFKFRFG